MQHPTDEWQSGGDGRVDLCSPRASPYRSFSSLDIPQLSPLLSSIPHPHGAGWPYRRAQSSDSGAYGALDYQSAASASASPSVDCYLVDDNDEQNSHPALLPSPSLLSVNAAPLDQSGPLPYPTPYPTPYSVPPAAVDERVMRRKLKHKLLDTERRKRENAALHALARLTAATSAGGSVLETSQQQVQQKASSGSALIMRSSVDRQYQHGTKRRRGCVSAGNSNSERVTEECDSSGKEQLAKVDVLERTVIKMDEVLADNDLKDRRIATLQFQLHAALAALSKREKQPASLPSQPPSADEPDVSLSPPVLSFVSAVDRSQCLSLRSFVRPHISLLSASLPHFRIVDVNSAHRRLTGWSDEFIVGKLMAWSLSKDERRRSDVAAIVKRLHKRENGDVWVQKVTQYPASGLALRELLRGNKEKVDMVWRMCKSNGRLYETECSFWLGGAVPMDAADECCEDEDITAINSNRNKYSDMSGIEAASKRLAGRYLIVAAAWQDATEVSS